MNNTLVNIMLIIILINLVISIIILSRKNSGKELTEVINKLLEVSTKLELLSREINRVETGTREEIARNRDELNKGLKENREEIVYSLKVMQERLNIDARENRLELNTGLKCFQDVMEGKLTNLQVENTKKLEEMRVTVDEKLQASVEKRFNESFKNISERLDQVHKGLGEMQTLANGVGDLKKVLTNVKTRGTLGEIQLGNILEQILSPEQYLMNAITKEGSSERVEFAVKLPGNNTNDKPVLLPIDAKFPIEDYQRLIDAIESPAGVNSAEWEMAAKQLENAVKKNAKDIRDKYINPPMTTDFAIMFVPTEGLYAEILRRTGLFELLQRDFKITVVGPSNLVAFLSSLQMGFRTLAIEKRSSEVWEILGAVKTEFGSFGDILDKTKKKLQEATNVLDRAGTRSRAIERKLKGVQSLPKEDSVKLLDQELSDEEDELIDEDNTSE